MDQQFSLSWNNFHGNLSKGFASLLGNGEFVDVTLAVEGHLLQAHKVILSICSPYFKKMFQLNPCQHPIVVLRDITHKAMRDLLQFMYHGEVSVNREELTSFIGTAEVLQIKGLTNKESVEEKKEQEIETTQPITDTIQTSDTELCMSENFESNTHNDVTQNIALDLLKQRELVEKLQRFSHLKRKSDEFLHKNFYSNILNAEKRTKFREKQNHSTQHFDNLKSVYDKSIDTTPDDLQPADLSNKDTDEEYKKDQNCIESPLNMKTECDDSDIVITDPDICSPSKNYDSMDGQNDISLPTDYQTTQESALSLVINGSSENHQFPVRYKYIYSRKGHKQLVHTNFVYTKHSTTHGKTSWRCVQYFSLNRCPATVETVEAMIYAVNHQHNHEDCYEKLSRNSIYEMSTSPT